MTGHSRQPGIDTVLESLQFQALIQYFFDLLCLLPTYHIKNQKWKHWNHILQTKSHDITTKARINYDQSKLHLLYQYHTDFCERSWLLDNLIVSEPHSVIWYGECVYIVYKWLAFRVITWSTKYLCEKLLHQLIMWIRIKTLQTCKMQS